MSLFSKFLTTISSVFPAGLSEKKLKLLLQLNPRKIHVENVRSLLDVSQSEAIRILEIAVRQGVFEKRVGVLCPDGTEAASAESEEALPPTVSCWIEEDGFPELETIATNSLTKVVWYRLNEHSRDLTYKRTA